MDDEKMNYFEKLNIKPDASVEEIAKRIDDKEDEWDKAQKSKNSEKQNEAIECLRRMDDIRNVMLSPDSEEFYRQRAEARKMIMDSEKQIVIALIGEEQLQDSEKKNLLKKFGTCGMDEKDVERLFEKAQELVKAEDASVPRIFRKEDFLYEGKAREIKNAIAKINRSDVSTLYDFLGKDKSASAAELKKAAEEKRDMIDGNAQKLTTDKPITNLCKICIDLFSGEETKKQYDNYLYLTTYGGGTGACLFIDKVVKKNPDKIFTQDAAVDFIRTMSVYDRELTAERSLNYIEDYCHYKDYGIGDLNRSLLISIFDDAGSEKPETVKDDTSVKQLKQTLFRGRESVKLICRKREEYRLCEERRDSYSGQAQSYKVKANQVKRRRNPNTPLARNVFIQRAAVLIILIAISIGLSIRAEKPWALSGVLYTVMAGFVIAAIVVSIRAFISFVRFMILFSRDGLETKQARDVFIRQKKDYERHAQEEENKMHDLESEIDILKQQRAQYLILPAPYTYDPEYYDNGLEYMERGAAENLDEIVSLLRMRYADCA